MNARLASMKPFALGLALGLALAVALPLAAGGGKGSSTAVLFAPSGKERRLERGVAEQIGAAQKTLDVAMYMFTAPELERAVLDAASRGVRVRILLDGEQARGHRSRDDSLRRSGKVDVRFVDLPGSGADSPKFHHKFAVIDGRLLITGSYNWTVLADEENHENLLISASEDVAKQYARQFDKIWSDKEITKAE